VSSSSSVPLGKPPIGRISSGRNEQLRGKYFLQDTFTNHDQPHSGANHSRGHAQEVSPKGERLKALYRETLTLVRSSYIILYHIISWACGSGKATAICSRGHRGSAACIPGLTGADTRLFPMRISPPILPSAGPRAHERAMDLLRLLHLVPRMLDAAPQTLASKPRESGA